MFANQTIFTGTSRRNGWFSKSQAALVLICTSYVVAFVVVYHRVTIPVWGYEGYRSIATPEHAAAGWALAILPSTWMPIQLRRPSALVYWLLYLLVIVPVCLVPIYSLQDQSNGPLWMATCVVGMFAVIRFIYKLPLLELPRVHLQHYEFLVVLMLLSFVFYALMVMSFGLHFHYVPLERVYSIRAQFKEILNQGSRLTAYAIGWQMYVINPLLMASGMITRRTFPAVAGFAGQLAIYSISGFRDVLFSSVFLLYLLWTMRSDKLFGVRLASTWVAIISAAGALEFFHISRTLAGLVGERMTAGPGLLTGYYYEFFSSHPKALLGQSIFFNSWVQYPYALGPAELIGYTYFRDSSMSANANLWADAYANFGYVGIVSFTILLAAMLWLYDSIAVGRDKRLCALVMALPAFALANSGLLTSLVTHGIGLAMLIVYLMPAVKGSAQSSFFENRSMHLQSVSPEGTRTL
jgi:hypothetical protein